MFILIVIRLAHSLAVISDIRIFAIYRLLPLRDRPIWKEYFRVVVAVVTALKPRPAGWLRQRSVRGGHGRYGDTRRTAPRRISLCNSRVRNLHLFRRSNFKSPADTVVNSVWKKWFGPHSCASEAPVSPEIPVLIRVTLGKVFPRAHVWCGTCWLSLVVVGGAPPPPPPPREVAHTF